MSCTVSTGRPPPSPPPSFTVVSLLTGTRISVLSDSRVVGPVVRTSSADRRVSGNTLTGPESGRGMVCRSFGGRRRRVYRRDEKKEGSTEEVGVVKRCFVLVDPESRIRNRGRGRFPQKVLRVPRWTSEERHSPGPTGRSLNVNGRLRVSSFCYYCIPMIMTIVVTMVNDPGMIRT